MKKIAILGSTGSIGTNTLRVVEQRPDDFQVIGLSAYRNICLLSEQIKRFRPKIVSVKDESAIKELNNLADLSGVDVFTQDDGLIKIATEKQVQTLVVATSGIISLIPTLLAIEQGKCIALANKEPLVMAGKVVMEKLKKHKGQIIPVDSEHSAIFQCIGKENINSVKRIYLTGSGGPFRMATIKQLKAAKASSALRHPKWKMGKKITIDSATLMNKGLELIEASWLFNIAPENIEILIHPEAIIHSMVEFNDCSVIAQLGITDMRLPIQYALDYPKRIANDLNSVDFFKMKALTFYKADEKKFPCLAIAKKVAEKGGSGGCVMNAANEVAVEVFLNNKIGFMDIPKVIDKVLKKHKFITNPSLDEILSSDQWARKEARLFC
ncbi:MAG: 1-deoxy-D-xylulose-5-phosphate reductoisomerase [Candidatus Omnitrophica bacterium]|nr:1-deoxy-D-xylulose-5-phosphate reductoisomerase [Candidatus Omnitrophota bacterium]